jgi:hypothetical protein
MSLEYKVSEIVNTHPSKTGQGGAPEVPYPLPLVWNGINEMSPSYRR